jgi:hypothetical protein
MPDKWRHRGAHPQESIFCAPTICRDCVLRSPILLTSGPQLRVETALRCGVSLPVAQRSAFSRMRCACSDESLARRKRIEYIDSGFKRPNMVLERYISRAIVDSLSPTECNYRS